MVGSCVLINSMSPLIKGLLVLSNYIIFMSIFIHLVINIPWIFSSFFFFFFFFFFIKNCTIVYFEDLSLSKVTKRSRAGLKQLKVIKVNYFSKKLYVVVS